MKVSVCLSALMLLVLSGWHEAVAQTQQSPLKAPPLQEWQVRREKLDHVINGVRQHDAEAMTQFDQILTGMEQHPHDRTPMEVLDVLGTYYVPNEGPEATLPTIATQLVLGWYDALRFATHSGRAEILDNEQFFKRAMVLSGDEVTNRSLKFLNDHQDIAGRLVAEGIKDAEPFRDVPSYDRHWPTAYGLERLLCASGEAEKCQGKPAMPKEQWDKAWADSKQAVTDFFSVKR